jgi:heat-inducible transcriptional repressor
MVDELYRSKIKQVEEILDLSSKLLSLLSHYTAVVQTPAMDVETIRHVNLVPLSSTKVVVVLVLSNGNIIKRIALLSHDITESEVDKLNAFLNEKICSLSFADARSLIESFKDSMSAAGKKLIGFATEIMDDVLTEDEREVYLDGIENIFDQPEFKDLNRLRPVIRVLDRKKHLNDLIEYCIPGDDVNGVCIRIGSENMIDDVRSCSVIVSPYRIGGRTRGAIGVIGPTRMQYSRASSVVGFMADKLGDVLTEMCRG